MLLYVEDLRRLAFETVFLEIEYLQLLDWFGRGALHLLVEAKCDDHLLGKVVRWIPNITHVNLLRTLFNRVLFLS